MVIFAVTLPLPLQLTVYAQWYATVRRIPYKRQVQALENLVPELALEHALIIIYRFAQTISS